MNAKIRYRQNRRLRASLAALDPTFPSYRKARVEATKGLRNKITQARIETQQMKGKRLPHKGIDYDWL